ncbi:MAG: CsgG/HfaB family protein [Candidatus Omnitrophota bacterium]
MIKKFAVLAFVLLFVCSFYGCAPFFHFGVKPDTAVVMPPYSGAKAKIAVADFDIKTLKAPNGVGIGMRSMLAQGLMNSNRFIVFNQDALKAAIQEHELENLSQISLEGKQIKPKAKDVDLIVAVTLVDFQPQSCGGKSGLGGGGSSASGDMGGLLGITSSKAHLTLEVRVINAVNSQVISLIKVQGQASDNKIGSIEGWQLNNNLSAFANTSMEKAIRRCLTDSVRYIVQSVPGSYYKY